MKNGFLLVVNQSNVEAMAQVSSSIFFSDMYPTEGKRRLCISLYHIYY